MCVMYSLYHVWMVILMHEPNNLSKVIYMWVCISDKVKIEYVVGKIKR